MKTIWHYTIPIIVGESVLNLPAGARFVHAAADASNFRVHLRYEVDPDLPLEPHNLLPRTTGEMVEDSFQHVCTVEDATGFVVTVWRRL